MEATYNFPHWPRLEKAKTIEDLRIPLGIGPKDMITTAMIIRRVAAYIHAHRPYSEETVRISQRIGRILTTHKPVEAENYFSLLQLLGIEPERISGVDYVAEIEEKAAQDSLYTETTFASDFKKELQVIDIIFKIDAKSRLKQFLESAHTKIKKAETLQNLLTTLLSEDWECFNRFNNYRMDDERETKVKNLKKEGSFFCSIDIENRDTLSFVFDREEIENNEGMWAFCLLTCQISEEILPVHVARRRNLVKNLSDKLSSSPEPEKPRLLKQLIENFSILEKESLQAFRSLAINKRKIQDLLSKNSNMHAIKRFLSYLDYAFSMLATEYFRTLCDSAVFKYNQSFSLLMTPTIGLIGNTIKRFPTLPQPTRYAFAKWQENRHYQYALYQAAYEELDQLLTENRGVQFAKYRKNNVTGEALSRDSFPKSLPTAEEYIQAHMPPPEPEPELKAEPAPKTAAVSPDKKGAPEINKLKKPSPSPAIVYHPRVERWYNHSIGTPLPKEVFEDYNAKAPQQQLLDHLSHAFPRSLESYLSKMAYKTAWQNEDEMEIIPAEMTVQGQPTIRGMLSRTKNALGEIYHSHFSPMKRSELLDKIVANSFKEADFPDWKKSISWSKKVVQVKQEAADEKLEIDPVFETITLNKVYTVNDQALPVTYKLYKACL